MSRSLAREVICASVCLILGSVSNTLAQYQVAHSLSPDGKVAI